METVELIKLVMEMIVVPLIVWGISVVNRRIAERTDLEYSKYVLLDITKIVESVVHETSQTFVDGLKAEGKFDEESAKVALEKSKARAIEIISPASYELLEQIVGDANAYIEAQIEATVWEQHQLTDCKQQEK